MTPLSIPVLVSLFFLRWWNRLMNLGELGMGWHSMPLKRNCFLSIAIKTLFWCLWRWMALSCQKRLLFVCLLWRLIDLWTGRHTCSPLPRLLRGKCAPFIGPSSSLILNPSCICTNLCMEYCPHIWGGDRRYHRLDQLDQVQKRVVSLVDVGLPSNLQALSCRRDVASLSLWEMFLWACRSRIPYLPNMSQLEALPFLSRCIDIQLILLSAGLSSINQVFSFHDSPLELPASECFPPDYDLTAFKGRVNKFPLLKWPVTPYVQWLQPLGDFYNNKKRSVT